MPIRMINQTYGNDHCLHFTIPYLSFILSFIIYTTNTKRVYSIIYQRYVIN